MEIGSPKASSIQIESQLSVRAINTDHLILKVGYIGWRCTRNKPTDK